MDTRFHNDPHNRVHLIYKVPFKALKVILQQFKSKVIHALMPYSHLNNDKAKKGVAVIIHWTCDVES